MDKDLVIAKLREHEDELRAAGAEHVSIFGSVARGKRLRNPTSIFLSG
ncbi:DUF881 domain-containing protein [Neorhizobium galegae]|nr:DUF881 domain-containing protein [Neorhizobium galegae]